MALHTGFSNFFFRNLKELRANQRGTAVYNATANLVNQFINECHSHGISTHLISLSRLPEKPIQAKENHLQIIYIDLTNTDYSRFAPKVTREFIRPALLRQQWTCYFSQLDRTELLKKTITPNSIHHNYEAVQNFLEAESIVHMLDKTVFSFPEPGAEEPEQEALLPEKIQEKYTPIPHQYELDSNLDADQTKAINTTNGPILVMAPAGSGKTRTLTNRIAHLINTGVPGERILALAFNRKAMQEMKDRLAEKGITQARVSTLHAFGYEIIRQKWGWHYEEKGNQKKLRTIIERVFGQKFHQRNGEMEDPLNLFLTTFRRAKLELTPFSDLDVKLESKPIDFESVFLDILEAQKQTRFLTFDDMVYFPIRVLLEEDDFRHSIQETFDYVLVDEFQDLNRAQLAMVNILSLPENNLFVVGDDDQMIYGWRGARVENILKFPERYQGCKEIILKTNYRSAKKIVRHTSWLVDHQVKRVKKNIQPRHQSPTGILEIRLGDGLWDQANIAADWISDTKESHYLQWQDFAILFRTNAHEVPAALALRRRGIPHSPINPINLYATNVGRDIFHTLQILLYPNNAPPYSFARFLRNQGINLPDEQIHQFTGWESLKTLANYSLWNNWQKNQLEESIRKIEILRELLKESVIQPKVFLTRLNQELNLTTAYQNQSENGPDMDNATDEMVFESILAISQGFDQLTSFYEHLHSHLKTSKNESTPPHHLDHEDSLADEVGLMTVHKSKGKEFPFVVYFDLSSTRAGRMETNLPEERRVAYVGITRAMDGLLVTANRQKPSPFIKELSLNPAFDDFALAYLNRQLKKTEGNIKRLRKEFRNLEEKQLSLIEKFPTLSQEFISERKQTPNDYGHLFRKKRYETVIRKNIKLKKESQAKQNRLTHFTEMLDIIETEIRFRRILGEKDDF